MSDGGHDCFMNIHHLATQSASLVHLWAHDKTHTGMTSFGSHGLCLLNSLHKTTGKITNFGLPKYSPGKAPSTAEIYHNKQWHHTYAGRNGDRFERKQQGKHKQIKLATDKVDKSQVWRRYSRKKN